MPKDPYMLLSYLNTQLRDYYSSLSELCREKDVQEADIRRKMLSIDYEYDEGTNQFI